MGYNRQQKLMRKKLLSFLLAIVAGLNFAIANSNGYYTISYTYTNSWIGDLPQPPYEAYVTGITPGESYSGSIDIPSSVYHSGKTYTVVAIWHKAFKNYKNLTSVTIPYSVKNIYDEAFSNCTSITTLTIPSSVTYIGSGAFNNILNVKYSGSSSGRPWGAKCINGFVDSIFVYSDDTKTELIGCSALATGNITIPNTVTSIGNNAFSGCSNLSSIEVPNSINNIGNYAFSGCSNLTAVHISDLAAWGRISFGNVYANPLNYAHNLYLNGALITELVIPDNLTSIGSYTFSGCSSLTSVTIPNSVTSIGEGAFWGCSGLTSIEIPNSVTSIGSRVFQGCISLTSIVWNATHCADFTSSSAPFYDNSLSITSFIFGEEVEYVPAYLCYNLKNAKIVVPNCNVEIGENAFTNCKLVRMNKLPDFNVTAKHEYDTPNSGSITKSIDNPFVYAGTYFYTLNGQKNASLYNLTAGEYRLVFHGDICGDSIVKNITIERYGMKVNGMYYLLDEDSQAAKVTYRGTSYDDYNGEYSGNITIPKTITFDGIEYQVTGIDYSAFSGCNNISSITMESETPIPMDYCGLSNECIIYVPYGSLNAYKSASGWSYYNIHVINPSHATTTTAATSAKITLGNTDEAKHISSCGMEGGEQEFAGNVIEYIGLEPNSEYADIPLFIKTKEGDIDNTTISFTTTALELTTKPSKPVSSTTAILLAETNMSDAEVSCGFEYKRNDAPADMEGNKVYCPVASGQMAGRLKGLKDDVYYKYRAFYQSAAGNMFYGDWQYIFTGDVAVEFDPILYTYGATVVRENEATISGYALAGSEDFTEQGFEYWAESRTNGGANAPHRVPAALNEHFFVQASGIALRATLTNLDAGTVYKYRVYGKVGDQYYYGAEQAFTTTGTYTPPTYTVTFANWDGAVLQSSQVEDGKMPIYSGETPVRPEDEQYTYTFSGWTPQIVAATADATYTAQYVAKDKHEGLEDIQEDNIPCTKVIRDGQIFILRGEKEYTLTGQEIK